MSRETPVSAVVAERVGSQSDQGLTDGHVELGGDHAGCLVHDVLEVGVGLELGRQCSRRRAGDLGRRTPEAAPG